MKTTLKPGEDGFERYMEIAAELATHRKAMRALKKERDVMLGRPVPGDRVVQAPAPAPPVFSTVPAGAPRAAAVVNPMAEKVRALFTAHPGIAFTAGTIAQALGLGDRLRGPAHEAVRALVRTKDIAEVGRGRYAKVVEATADDLSLPAQK